MRHVFCFALCTAWCTQAFAEVTFEWVEVGNPGNVADPLNQASIPGIGTVDYKFLVSKYPVTNDQYAEFLNHVGASGTGEIGQIWIEAMGTDPRGGITRSGAPGSYTYTVKANMGDKPANLVSFLGAMRFVNWLHNGQPSGAQDATTTEDGTYTIEVGDGIDSGDGLAETRAAHARFFIPTENEWYKAAYHQPAADGGDGDDYWLYSTASNSVPAQATANATGDISNPGANVANYGGGADWNGQDGNVTTVGSAGPMSVSYYGTSDQSGNVLEWTETLFHEDPNPGCPAPPCSRVVRGGSWDNPELLMQSAFQTSFGPIFGDQRVGFRVARPALNMVNAGINDAWVNLDTLGQGFFFNVFPVLGKMFVAMFTYDTERPPVGVTAMLGGPGQRWLTGLGDIDGNTVVVPIELTTGGIFNSGLPEPGQTPNYGTFVIVFTDCNHATVTYDFPSLGLQGVIELSRATPDNVALCEVLDEEL
jgi:formylglycine-generating enzyme required for sulfatase activity